MKRLRTLAITTFVVLSCLCSSEADCGIIVNFGDVELDSTGRGRLEVFAQHDGVGAVPQIDSFSLRLFLEPIGNAKTGEVRFSDDNEAFQTRTSDPRHLFAGTTPLIFMADAFDFGQQFEVIDSVNFPGPSTSLNTAELLTAVNLESDPLATFGGDERFSVRVDPTETNFFDSNFTLIPASEFNFGVGTIAVASAAVPEPSSLFTFVFVVAAACGRRRRC